jgi:hypothetical protein
MRLANVAEAREALDDARRLAYRTNCLELQLECELNVAFCSLNEGMLDEAEQLVDSSIRFADLPNLPDDSSYVFSRPGMLVRLLQAQATFAGARADYPKVLRCNLEALRVFDNVPEADPWSETYVIINASNMVRDADLEGKLADELLRRARCLPASPYLVTAQFITYRDIAYSKASEGDILGAFRLFREASQLDVDLPLRAFAALDTFFIARAVGQTKKAQRELEIALGYAARVDWEANDTDQRLVLLMLARAAASKSTELARNTLELYKRIKREISVKYAARYDPRMNADLAMTEGIVAKSEGRDEYAEEFLARAFAFWHSTRIFKRNAVEAALELAEITADPQLLAYADAWLAERPLSYVASIAARVRREIVRRQR